MKQWINPNCNRPKNNTKLIIDIALGLLFPWLSLFVYACLENVQMLKMLKTHNKTVTL